MNPLKLPIGRALGKRPKQHQDKQLGLRQLIILRKNGVMAAKNAKNSR